jgi:hypothetical protein
LEAVSGGGLDYEIGGQGGECIDVRCRRALSTHEGNVGGQHGLFRFARSGQIESGFGWCDLAEVPVLDMTIERVLQVVGCVAMPPACWCLAHESPFDELIPPSIVR